MENKFNLNNKHISVMGNKDSGKTMFCKFLLNQNPMSMVFDPMAEYNSDKYNTLKPSVRRGNEAHKQLGEFLDGIIIPNKDKIQLLILEEVNRYHNKNADLNGALGELTDVGSSHYGIATVYVYRRPQQVNSDIRELSDEMFIFRSSGVNTMKYLKNISKGLDEAVESLGSYEFVWVHSDRTYEICSKIDIGNLK